MSYASPTIEVAGTGSIEDHAVPQITAILAVVIVLAVEAIITVVAEITVAIATVVTVGVGCFTGDTKISLADGNIKNIEEIKIGDLVKAYDERKKRYITSKVVNTFCHEPYETPYYLIINDNLKVTPNHPMFINNKWTRANELNIGDSLLDINGNIVIVRSIDKVYKNVPVYNLEVD